MPPARGWRARQAPWNRGRCSGTRPPEHRRPDGSRPRLRAASERAVQAMRCSIPALRFWLRRSRSVPIALRLGIANRRAGRHADRMARRKRTNAFDQRHRLAHGAKEQIRGNCLRRRVALERSRWPAARAPRRRKAAAPSATRVIERLDAQRIACQENARRASGAALRHLDHGEGKHSLQPLGAALAPLFVGVDDDFGVGARAESMAAGIRAPRAARGNCRFLRCRPPRAFRFRSRPAGCRRANRRCSGGACPRRRARRARTPSSSGPRCTIAAIMRRTCASPVSFDSIPMAPQIPHIRDLLPGTKCGRSPTNPRRPFPEPWRPASGRE